MDNKEFELLLGIVSLIISLLFGYREIKNWNSIEKDDYMLKSFSVEKTVGIIGLFLVGIVIIYRYFS